MSRLKSSIYKLVLNNIIVAEGSAKEMRRLRKQRPGSFVGLGSPEPSVGQVWDKTKETGQ